MKLKKILKKTNKILESNKFSIIFFVLFSSLTLFFTIKHNLWRDEAQSFMLSKNLSIKELFKQLASEGHPCLWYLVLKIFIFFGIKYKYIGFISWGISTIATFILIFFVDLDKKIKYLFCFSTQIIYFTINARSYCLIYLLLVLLMIIYNKRFNYPIIYGFILLLLLNTHILIAGLVGGLFCIDLYEFIMNKNKKILISLFLTLLGCAIVFFTLASSLDVNVSNNSISNRMDWFKPFVVIYKIFAQNYTSFWIFSLIVFFLYCCSLKREKKINIIFILCCSLIFYIGVFTFIYGISHHTAFFFVFYLIFCFYLYLSNNLKRNKKSIMYIYFFLLISCISSFSYFRSDINSSDVENIAKFISKSDEFKKFYCLDDVSYCVNIEALLDSNKYMFIDYYNETNIKFKDFKFINLSKSFYSKPVVIENLFDGDYLILSNRNIDNLYTNVDLKNYDYEIIYESNPPKFANIETDYYAIVKLHNKNYIK